MFAEMRRKDRELTEQEARNILQNGEYGILSTVGEDGCPYGIPLSYAVKGDLIFFHCAPDAGQKLQNLGCSDKVCFTVVGETEVMPEKYGTKYESAVLFGRARSLEGAEKQQALESLIDKYAAQFREGGLRYIHNSFDKTAAYEIRIEHITGKARRK